MPAKHFHILVFYLVRIVKIIRREGKISLNASSIPKQLHRYPHPSVPWPLHSFSPPLMTSSHVRPSHVEGPACRQRMGPALGWPRGLNGRSECWCWRRNVSAVAGSQVLERVVAQYGNQNQLLLCVNWTSHSDSLHHLELASSIIKKRKRKSESEREREMAWNMQMFSYTDTSIGV